MKPNLISFVWRYSRAAQIRIVLITLLSFPIIWWSLELPKLIIDDAIGGDNFPRFYLGVEMNQMDYLLALCFTYLLAISLNNGVKFYLNFSRGVLGERMLRRMRYSLLRRAMNRPLDRLRNTSPGELVQMISAELAPIGDFIGAIFATPIMQGGSFLVYLGFILMQNAWIGLATLLLYPVQAFVVPILQRRVVKMIRARLVNIRAMTREIAETIEGAEDVRALHSDRWHMAMVSQRLYENFLIRKRIFILKFLIKFINNVANHLTPFFIFLIGGWFVVQGELEIGALTAVLIAYKDLAAPWKELLRFYQDFSDMSARFENVVEQFADDGLDGDLDAVRKPDPAPEGVALALSGAKIENIPNSVNVQVPLGGMTLVLGPAGPARANLLSVLSGAMPPVKGKWMASEPLAYRAAALVRNDTMPFTGQFRDVVLEGLRVRPVAPAMDAEAVIRQRESGLTGAPEEDDLQADWINPAEAGYSDLTEIDQYLGQVIHWIGADEGLYEVGLQSHLSPDEFPRETAAILALREKLVNDDTLKRNLNDFVDVWAEGKINYNAPLGENLFKAKPVDPNLSWHDLLEIPEIFSQLDNRALRAILCQIGVELCATILSLFEGVSENSALFAEHALFPKSDTPEIEAIVAKARRSGVRSLNKRAQKRMMAIALSHVPARRRVMPDMPPDTEEKIATLTPALRVFSRNSPHFAYFDADQYNPALTVLENITFGPRRLNRTEASASFREQIDRLIIDASLRDAVIRAGLRTQIGHGGIRLNTMQRRRLGIARALMKKPAALLVDSFIGGDHEDHKKIRDILQQVMNGGALIVASDRDALIPEAATIIRVDATGRVTQDKQTIAATAPLTPQMDNKPE